jgi:hypothetical protein
MTTNLWWSIPIPIKLLSDSDVIQELGTTASRRIVVGLLLRGTPQLHACGTGVPCSLKASAELESDKWRCEFRGAAVIETAHMQMTHYLDT